MTAAYAPYRRSRAYQDLSIEEQRHAVRTWAGTNGYFIVREFAADASGLDTARRRDFLTLLQICAQPGLREADVVLCYDISRFSRLDPEEAGFHEYSSGALECGWSTRTSRVLTTQEPRDTS
jgi:DNA invertase Pin-like site-specific DNA recombinase